MDYHPAVLNNDAILKCMKENKIIIFPFNKNQLNSASYDVTLGKYYFRCQKPKDKWGHNIYNIYSEEHVRRVWGEAQESKPYSYYKNKGIILENIKDEELIIWIHPGETLLCHTNEFIGSKSSSITSMMKTRSSMGRSGLATCKCSGFGDINYFNIWTMEVSFAIAEYRVPLVVGRRVAQIIFIDTGKDIDPETTYEKTGKYQSSSDLKVLVETWTPECMLPKLWRDIENDPDHIPTWFRKE